MSSIYLPVRNIKPKKINSYLYGTSMCRLSNKRYAKSRHPLIYAIAIFADGGIFSNRFAVLICNFPIAAEIQFPFTFNWQLFFRGSKTRNLDENSYNAFCNNSACSNGFRFIATSFIALIKIN